MTARSACRACGRPLARPATGRPPTYCSEACRRSAEFGIRRADRLLAKLEDQASATRVEIAAIESYGGRTAEQHARLTALEAEIVRHDRRMRELMSDQPEMSGVEPTANPVLPSRTPITDAAERP
jgi:hypothetical protein